MALSDYASVVNRLAIFEESCENAGGEHNDDGRQIDVIEDSARVDMARFLVKSPGG